MRQKPAGRQSSSEHIIKDIKRKTRKQYSAEEKIRIVLDGLQGAFKQHDVIDNWWYCVELNMWLIM